MYVRMCMTTIAVTERVRIILHVKITAQGDEEVESVNWSTGRTNTGRFESVVIWIPHPLEHFLLSK